MVEIKGQDSFERWLEGRSQDEAVAIAARSAMRATPALAWLFEGDGEEDPRALLSPLLRATLISGVARRWPTPDMISAADSARSAARSAVRSADYARSAESAVRSAESAVRSADFAESAVHSAYSTVGSADSAAYSVLSEDCERLANGASAEALLNAPLWPSGLPEGRRQDWERLDAIFAADPAFAFWRRWYQGALDGKPVNWEVQRDVALIPADIWEAGPDRVAEKIARIEADHLAQAAPLAETVEINSETGLLRAVPIAVEDRPLFTALLGQVEDVLDATLSRASNGLSEAAFVVVLLRGALTRHANDPQRVEMNFTSAAKSLHRQIDETQDLPPSEENLTLRDAVEDAVRGIRATHPEVAKNRETLAQQALKELSPDEKASIQGAAPLLTAISEGEMRADYEADIPELASDAVFPPMTGAPPLPGLDPATRVFGRVAESNELLRSSRERIDAIATSSGFKAAIIFSTLENIVRIGLRIFGVL